MKTRLSRLREAADLAWLSAVEAPADKRGPLLAQFRATLAEIDQLSIAQTKKAGDPVDEVAQRRSARRAGPASGEGRARRTR